MNKTFKGILIIVILLLIIGALYYFVIYKKDKPKGFFKGLGGISPEDNYKMIQENLGVKGSESRVTVKFNQGINQADFYNNGRLAIGKIGATGYLVKGSYYNGGKYFELDNGKIVTGNSVWKNMEDSLK